jgi:Fe-S-cluster-containing dehydrogenase component
MYLSFLGDSLFELINNAVDLKEFAKAQKYFYLALADGVLKGEKSPCSNCTSQKCLSVCPAKSIFLQRSKDGEATVKINENTCEYCFTCMRNCPCVNLV